MAMNIKFSDTYLLCNINYNTYNMADITMSLDDTLEIDTIIEESSKPLSPVTVTNGIDGTDFNSKGINTGTYVFDPISSGTYNLNINGQELTVEVTDPSTIPDTVIKDAVSRWQLNSTSDSSIAIDSDDDNNATINGASYTSDAREGSNALSLNSSNNDYLTLNSMPSNLQLANDSTLTIATWMKTTSSSKGTIMGTWGGNAKGFMLEIRDQDNDGDLEPYITFRNPSNGDQDIAYGETHVNDGNWHFIVGVRDGNDGNALTVYTDGEEDNTTVDLNQGSGTFNSSANFNIGRQARGQSYYDGIIDDVWAIETALSAQTISEWYDAY